MVILETTVVGVRAMTLAGVNRNNRTVVGIGIRIDGDDINGRSDDVSEDGGRVDGTTMSLRVEWC